MKLLAAVLMTLAATMLCESRAAAQDSAQVATPDRESALRTLRYQREDEDWRWLARGAREQDRWDPLKLIPLGSSNFLSVGSDMRAYYEYFRNENWGAAPAENNDYLQTRALLHVDWRSGGRLRGFGQLKAIDVHGREGGPRPNIDRNELDLHQLFAEIDLSSSDSSRLLRIGRQELAFGRMRVVSTRDGAINGRQSQEGVRAILRSGDWRLDLFAVRLVATLPGTFDDESEGQPLWSGAYLTRGQPTTSGADFYLLGYDARRSVYFSGTGRERRRSVGTHWWGRNGNWDHDLEALYQFGTFGEADISAYSISGEAGYTFTGTPWNPRMGIAATLSSGDRDSTDAELNTYRPLQSRSPYGQLAALGYPNVQGMQLSVSGSPTARLRLTGRNYWLWRESTAEGIYSGGSIPLRPGNRAQGQRIGIQSELELEYNVDRHLRLGLVASRLSAGEYIQEGFPAEDVWYAAGSAVYRF